MLIADISKNDIRNPVIYARVNDTNSYPLEVKTVNGTKVVDLTGVDIKFEGTNSRNKLVTGGTVKIVDAKRGLFNYTFDEKAFLVDGYFREAYFRFHSKGKTDSSQDLKIRVISDVGLSEEEIGDIIALDEEILKHINEIKNEAIKQQEELKKEAQKTADEAKKISEKAFDEVKNIILNQDLNPEKDIEVVQSRGKHETLPIRLDSEIGDVSLFRDFDESIILKLKNEATERSINVKWFGAKGDGINLDSSHIQKALDMGGNIFIPEGEYLIEKQLILSANTNLVIDDKAILYNHIHQTQPKGLKGISILANYDVDTPVDGYNLSGNITITGGTLCGVRSIEDKKILEPLGDIGQDGISISHAENIRIESVNVKNIFRGHGIEITGCNKVDVINCTLDGCILTSVDIAAAREAIQLEHSGTNTSPSLQDKTVTKNIRVIGCEITKTDDWANHWASGIGSHNNDNEAPMENIIFEKNRIKDCSFGGILVINYKNAEFNNNVIYNCERGIHYYSSRPWDNVRIKGNRIEKINKLGIAVYEKSNNITIADNMFMDIKDTAIISQDSNMIKLFGNEFIDCGTLETANASVVFYGISNSEIKNNTFKSTKDNSIQRALFISETADLKNRNVSVINNAIMSKFKVIDIYVSDSAIFSNLLLSKEFPIFKNSQISLSESILKYKTLTIDAFIGVDASVVVPVSRSMKVVITNVSKGANSVSFNEFTILTNTIGDKLTITQDRISTITDGGQYTQDITQTLKMNIKQIKGNY